MHRFGVMPDMVSVSVVACSASDHWGMLADAVARGQDLDTLEHSTLLTECTQRGLLHTGVAGLSSLHSGSSCAVQPGKVIPEVVHACQRQGAVPKIITCSAT